MVANVIQQTLKNATPHADVRKRRTKRPPSATGIPAAEGGQSLSLFFAAELFVVIEVLLKLHPPEKEGTRLLDHL